MKEIRGGSLNPQIASGLLEAGLVVFEQLMTRHHRQHRIHRVTTKEIFEQARLQALMDKFRNKHTNEVSRDFHWYGQFTLAVAKYYEEQEKIHNQHVPSIKGLGMHRKQEWRSSRPPLSPFY